MTNKLVVIINSLKVPKIKKILLYEMKFLVPNYSCLQDPWLGGYRPQIPVLSVLNWICWTFPPPRTIFVGTPLVGYTMFRGSVKGTGYPLQFRLPFPCVTVCHHVSTGLYQIFRLCHISKRFSASFCVTVLSCVLLPGHDCQNRNRTWASVCVEQRCGCDGHVR